MSDKISDKLLNCPFCGGEAKLDYDLRFDDWFIKCNKCFCKTRTFKTSKSAILTWNNRKPMKRILERLQEEAVFFEDSYGNEVLCVPENIAIEIVKQEGGD